MTADEQNHFIDTGEFSEADAEAIPYNPQAMELIAAAWNKGT